MGQEMLVIVGCCRASARVAHLHLPSLVQLCSQHETGNRQSGARGRGRHREDLRTQGQDVPDEDRPQTARSEGHRAGEPPGSLPAV